MAGPQAAGDAGGSPQHIPEQAAAADSGWTRAEQLAALAKLREPFPDSSIAKRPQLTCGRCRSAEYKECDQHKKKSCDGCGQYVSPAHIHLDYVGHAEATDRLLEVDPLWSWEPMAYTQEGLPLFTKDGLWIRLTVAGVTRLGFGDASGKGGPNAVKEVIGDAIRNAGMRFGMALDLWAKTNLHELEPSAGEKFVEQLRRPNVWNSERGLQMVRQQVIAAGEGDFVVEAMDWMTLLEVIDDRVQSLQEVAAEKEARRAEQEQQAAAAVAQVAAEHGVTPATAQAPAPAPAAAEEQWRRDFAAFTERVRNGWNHPGATEMAINEAKAKGWLAEQLQGPDGAWYGVEALLRGRLAELLGQPAPTTGAYAAAETQAGQTYTQQEVA